MQRAVSIDDARRRRGGFTLLEVMIVVAIIGLLLAIAVPSWIRTRETAQREICIENLQQIETAKQLWALEHTKAKEEVPDEEDLIGAGLYLKTVPQCPASGEYDFMSVGEKATCTIEGHELPIGGAGD
jgi:prepilin-type N-terminal cleavage/methylation domain-containing protein